MDGEVKEKIHFIPVSDLSQVLKTALVSRSKKPAHTASSMQATSLIAGDKQPATVM